jgi:hypothetical protein
VNRCEKCDTEYSNRYYKRCAECDTLHWLCESCFFNFLRDKEGFIHYICKMCDRDRKIGEVLGE